MGLFSKLRENKEEKAAAQEANAQRLEGFEPTLSVGDVGAALADYLLIDEQAGAFVIATGPLESFKDRNPWVIEFSQVEKAEVHIDEYWSENYEYGQRPFRGMGNLTLDRYDEVFWVYDYLLDLKTTHPYAKKPTCRFNEHPLGTKVPSKGLFARRGLGLGCYVSSSDEAAEKAQAFGQLAQEESERNARAKIFDIVTLQRPEGIFDKIIADGIEDFRVVIIQLAERYMEQSVPFLKLLGQ